MVSALRKIAMWSIAASMGALMTTQSALADVELGSLQLLSEDNDTSPIPRGFAVGGVALGTSARYEASGSQGYVIPGFVYFGDDLLYVGDRGRYYFHRNENFAAFAYGRVRFGNLDPDDEREFEGMDKRHSQLEAGLGANIITPYALLTARASTDITGTSNGQEMLLWADFPWLHDRWLVMPGMGVVWRSSKMANYYFGGVSDDEATFERPSYSTGATVSPMVSLITMYRISKNWIGTASLAYEHYDSDIADSPLIDTKGETTFLIGAGYTW
ncbi:Structural protein MipA [Pseudomonas marincola]|uniref:Structural protein MipA n=2 Tax=Pseudomonas marincola TaxID=437900 RepID=A0A653E7R7_9PSED|nr:Structural protein MipA [Pseudomonas marincola]